jgi:hypothetical protein
METAPLPGEIALIEDDDAAAEARALATAIALAEADPRRVMHVEVRPWTMWRGFSPSSRHKTRLARGPGPRLM